MRESARTQITRTVLPDATKMKRGLMDFPNIGKEPARHLNEIILQPLIEILKCILLAGYDDSHSYEASIKNLDTFWVSVSF